MKNYKTVHVNVKNGYDIKIGENLIQTLGEEISSMVSNAKVAIISDDIVYAKYGKNVEEVISKKGIVAKSYVFSHGEENKNLITYGKILEFLAINGFDRGDVIVALGGGVVGDTAGFVSATYLRGIKYVQVPTTLLSAVDSSVGGKTAVDLIAGKNLVGAFYQPSLVLIDTNIIANLPKDVFLDGMGEVLKYSLLSKDVFDLLNSSNYSISELIYLCIDYKKRIVEEDEFENGNRKLLNLGHTPAHAIELLSQFKITHGRAVALGLRIIVNYCLKINRITQGEYDSFLNIYNKFIEDEKLPYTNKEMYFASLSDKKRLGDSISIVVIDGIGKPKIEKIKLALLEEVYS